MTEQAKELLRLVEAIAEPLDQKEQKKYKIETIKKIIEVSDRLRLECSECVQIFNDMGHTIDLLKSAVYAPKDRIKPYLANVTQLQKHFHKAHGFVQEGQYMTMGVALGLCFGVAFSSAINNFAYMALGLPIGIAIGAGLDEDAKKKGKVI